MMNNNNPEVSRPYFEREARLGCKVIFQWTPYKRWPLSKCPGQQHVGPEDWCPLCSDKTWIEGLVFATEDDAQNFNLDKLGSICEHCEVDHKFSSWELATEWLMRKDVHFPPYTENVCK